MNIIAEKAVAKLVVAFVAVAMLFTLATPAKAATIEELQAQIAALMAQIAALSGGSSSDACTFTRSLTIGSEGADVTCLQDYLTPTYFNFAGGSTGYFGPVTEAAVAAWQAANGVSPAVGYFGPISQAKYNAMMITGGSSSGSTSGGSLSGGEASIDNGYNAKNGEDTDLEEGQTDAPVMDVEFDVEDADIEINRIDVAVDHQSGDENDPWDVIETLSLWVDGDMIAEMDVDSKSDWEEDKPETGDYRARFSGLDWVVREDDTAEFTVGVTLADSIDGNTGSWQIFIPSEGIRGQDAENISQYTGETTDFVTFTFGAEGGDDELKVSEASSNPDATTLALESNSTSGWETILAFDLDTDDSVNDIIVETIETGVILSSSTFDGVISDARLVVDGENFSDFSYTDGMIAALSFDIDDELVIDAGDEVTAELQVKFLQLAAGNEGITVYATTSADDIEADGADDLEGSQLSGSVTGETHTLRSEGAIIEIVSTSAVVDEADFQGDDETVTFTIKYKVTAFETDLYIPKSAASGTAAGSNGAKFLIEDAAGDQIANVGTTTASLSSTADTSTGGNFEVTDGSTETFTLTIVYNPTSATEGFLQAQLYGVNYDTDDSDTTPDTQQRALPESDFETDQADVASAVN